jgi:hypothetical protein
MSGTGCRALVLLKFGLFFWLALGTCVFADDFTLQNQSLQLVFRIAPLPGGGISIIKIRDIQAGIDWLTGPSELFELSAGGKIWSSNNQLIEDSLSVNGDQLEMTAHTSGGEFTSQLQIRLPAGTGPATISASVKNQGQDWFGPFFLGDQGSGAIPVFPVDAELAVVQRNPQQEELLVSGFDGILYTSEERNDGPWSVPTPLQSTNSSFRDLFLPGAAIAAVRRNFHQRDAFAIGKDGLLHSVFRLDDNWWSDPIQISALRGMFPPDGSVAAISVNEQTDPATASEPRVSEVAVFAVSVNGQVRWTREVNDGPFAEPTPINGDPRNVGPHAHLVAVKRNQTQRDLFAIDQQGVILTAFQLGSATDWSNWIPLSRPDPRIIQSNSRFAAVRGSGDSVYLFVAGAAAPSSPLARIYETHEIDDGAWTNLAPISPPVSNLATGTDITAVRRSGGEIDVLAVLKDGTIGFLTRNLDGSWSNFGILPAAQTIHASGKLASILRRPQQLDVFGVNSPSGKIWTNADGAGTAFLRTVFPKIIFTAGQRNDLNGAFGMVPQEVGSLTALDPRRAPYDVLGMPYLNDLFAQGFGLPEAMNFQEVANISRGQRSLFFADLGGNVERGQAPIQFTVSPDEVDGFWVSEIKGGHSAGLSFAIGAGDRDWRRAIDYFLSQHSESSRVPDTPAWL